DEGHTACRWGALTDNHRLKLGDRFECRSCDAFKFLNVSCFEFCGHKFRKHLRCRLWYCHRFDEGLSLEAPCHQLQRLDVPDGLALLHGDEADGGIRGGMPFLRRIHVLALTVAIVLPNVCLNRPGHHEPVRRAEQPLGNAWCCAAASVAMMAYLFIDTSQHRHTILTPDAGPKNSAALTASGHCSAQSLQMQSVCIGLAFVFSGQGGSVMQSSQSMYCVHASQRSPPQRSHSTMGPESTARQLWHFTAALREVRRGVGMRQSIRFS